MALRRGRGVGDTGLASDPRFLNNPRRVANRQALDALLAALLAASDAGERRRRLDAPGLARVDMNGMREFAEQGSYASATAGAR